MSDNRRSDLWLIGIPVLVGAMFLALMVGRTRTPDPTPLPHWVPPLLGGTLSICIGAWLLMPLIRAWAKRIEGRGHEAVTLDDLAEMRERMAELELSNARVHELEERLDFAERLLAQRIDAPLQLPMYRTPV